MPSKNRPLVRDGRLQAKKKRTDRSYLSSAPSPATAVEEPAADEVAEDAEPALDAVAAPATDAADAAPGDASIAEAPAPAAQSATPASAAAAGRLPTTVRAMQQQGVRKRRAFDVHALALRDSQYAIHEMRRIFILAAMVITTLIVLGFVLR